MDPGMAAQRFQAGGDGGYTFAAGLNQLVEATRADALIQSVVECLASVWAR